MKARFCTTLTSEEYYIIMTQKFLQHMSYSHVRLFNAQHCSPMVPKWACSIENGRHLYLQDWHGKGPLKENT